MKPLPPGLVAVDALHDYDHVESRLAASGSDDARPFVTVAVPTFRRPDLLKQTVESILRQDFDRRVEIVVVDNDPDSTGATELTAALPELAGAAFRYYVNAENIGMYPNHNRCLKLARGEWVSILNDDDLLKPEFLSVIFAELDQQPTLKGLISRKEVLDERAVITGKPSSPLFMAGYRLWLESYFAGRRTRRVAPASLFWSTVGNLAGFVFRREAALELGGFQLRDELSADHWFFIRFSVRYGLHQHRAELARVRISRNESMRPDTLRSFIAQGVRMRRAIVGHLTPGWYARLEPMLMARERFGYLKQWGVDLPKEEIEREHQVQLPTYRPLVYHVLRLVLRA